jgi:hypothetical protein
MDSEINEMLYRRIDVWKRINSDKVVRYICFELLQEQMFCVQSADFIDYPARKERIINSEVQAANLLLEFPPEEREGKYSTLIEAIRAHDKEFVDFGEVK